LLAIQIMIHIHEIFKGFLFTIAFPVEAKNKILGFEPSEFFLVYDAIQYSLKKR